MEKSQQGISSGVSGDVVASVTTVARSKSSRKNANRPISKGPGLSRSDSINIVMNALNQLQEYFGEISFVNIPDENEPSLLVLPITLSTCDECGLIIERKDGPFCKWHKPLDVKNVPAIEAAVV